MKEKESVPLIFSMENVSIGFDGVSVLENVSFSLRKNEIHALVGKNGAGKSTLMKILSGVYKPNKGTLYLSGNEIKTGRSDLTLKEGLSMVYQDLSLVPDMTVTQNVFLAYNPFKKWGILSDSKARQQANSIFETMGVNFISPDAFVKDLSVGEAQLVEIAKALSHQLKIIVFDEPTASLSEIETAGLFKIIKNLKSQGISIIYITHYLEDVMTLCDRVTVLRDGKAVSTAVVEKTSVSEIVSHMLGEESNELKRDKRQFSSKKEKPLLEIKKAETDRVGPVSLYAREGEVIGLAGLLGSGRTEILRMLYGLDKLHSGKIFVNGKEQKIHHPYDAKKLGIALVPEERRNQGLVLDFSVEWNLTLMILNKLKDFVLLNRKRQLETANQFIAKLHIKTNNAWQKTRLLSGGNQQKVVFGKCLTGDPSVLLLDDPTFGVDVHAKREIMKIIEEFVNLGNIALFVSSELGEIANFCDRTYIVRKKRIVQEVGNASLTEKSILKMVQ